MAKKNNSNTTFSSTIEDLLTSASCAPTNTTSSNLSITGGLTPNSIYIPTTTSTSNNLTWGVSTGASNGYVNIDMTEYYNKNLINFVKYMKESEIIEIVERIQANEDQEFAKEIVNTTVSNRHMSENFLLKYISYLSLDTIKKQHTADIATGEYSDVALYFKLK